MSFTWEWALAIFVFLFANLFLGVQLLKLFWPLRMLKLTAKMRKEAVDPQLGLYDCNTGAGLCAAAVGERK